MLLQPVSFADQLKDAVAMDGAGGDGVACVDDVDAGDGGDAWAVIRSWLLPSSWRHYRQLLQK